MNLYLDDDSVHGVLIRLLEGAGHDVLTPADVALVGADDSVHLTRTIFNDRVLVSHNHDDFNNLHELVAASNGRHPGILIIRKDNDPRRDMTPRGIVNAIAKLVAANAPIEKQFVILNHWR